MKKVNGILGALALLISFICGAQTQPAVSNSIQPYNMQVNRLRVQMLMNGSDNDSLIVKSSVYGWLRRVPNKGAIAHGWGNHSLAGYIKLESDPTVSSFVKSINSDMFVNGNTAFSWGDHNAAGYLKSFTETDPTVSAYVKSITAASFANGNTAYSWGNHAGLYRAITWTPSSADISNSLGFTPASTATLNTKEPTITPGTTTQYWRGDKTWQTLPLAPGYAVSSATVGLSKAILNATYPNTAVGFTVLAPSIILGGAIYIRATTGTSGVWHNISAPPVL